MFMPGPLQGEDGGGGGGGGGGAGGAGGSDPVSDNETAAPALNLPEGASKAGKDGVGRGGGGGRARGKKTAGCNPGKDRVGDQEPDEPNKGPGPAEQRGASERGTRHVSGVQTVGSNAGGKKGGSQSRQRAVGVTEEAEGELEEAPETGLAYLFSLPESDISVPPIGTPGANIPKTHT